MHTFSCVYMCTRECIVILQCTILKLSAASNLGSAWDTYAFGNIYNALLSYDLVKCHANTTNNKRVKISFSIIKERKAEIRSGFTDIETGGTISFSEFLFLDVVSNEIFRLSATSLVQHLVSMRRFNPTFRKRIRQHFEVSSLSFQS